LNSRLCDIDDSLRCTSCGRRAGSRRVIRACRPRPGIGDRVAAALSAVGVTQARAQAVAQAFGLADCGCGGRRQMLNRAGWAMGIGTPPPPPTGPTG
jgi:hypothetical protein